MSVLIVAGDPSIDHVVVYRLLEQGDEVRVLTSSRVGWEKTGVHLAVGDPSDADLVERAAQNARTVVVTGRYMKGDFVEPIVAGATAAGVDRFVGCDGRIEDTVRDRVERSSLSYVLVSTGRGRLRRGAGEHLVAEAVDAADDLAGEPRLHVDLTKPDQLSQLEIRSG